MLVYMLLNEVEERCYIGQTTKTLETRLSEHWAAAKDGSNTRLHEAMRRWDDRSFWTHVVLQNCYEAEQLDPIEAMWIELCGSKDHTVGYNERLGSPEKKRTAQPPMTEERREFFRECGRRGAAKSRTLKEP